MRKSRFSIEEIMQILKEWSIIGSSVSSLWIKLGMSASTFIYSELSMKQGLS